jgi:hypothetical protein
LRRLTARRVAERLVADEPDCVGSLHVASLNVWSPTMKVGAHLDCKDRLR